ncbi:MAG: hypothetical protein CMO64_00625 [Verrucomicrobiales bacterium]|nr:hypothetical protein [Verrucomicrobiales bacterium]
MLKNTVLEPPDTHYMSAAEGWMDLGDLNEALSELSQISAEKQDHFDVMQLRWHVHNKRKEWEDCLRIGRSMISANPDLPQGWINHGNALFYLNRYEEAFHLLHPVLEKFPSDEAIPYNLACYKCQSGELMEARRWLERAYAVGDSGRIRKMALNDPDLKPLWTHSGAV